MAALDFIGVPIDSVGRDGGTEQGPAALRELGLPAALGGVDRGDLEVRIRGEERDPETGLLGSADVLTTTRRIRERVAEALGAGRGPFLAGGCCAELPGALAGARDARGEIGLIHFDGHLDLYDGETSPTGEAADMPISVALGLGPRAWVEAAGGAGVDSARMALVGFRDREESLEYGMRQPETLSPAPRLLPATALHDGDPRGLAEALEAEVAAAGPFWLHVDVDVLDEAAFPATDYLMPGGLSWEEAEPVLSVLLASPALIGASLGCYNPAKDRDRSCGTRLVAALSA